MTAILTFATIIEAGLLVLVLAVALARVRSRLTAIADALRVLAEGVLAIERDLRQIRPAAAGINEPLRTIVGALPTIAGLAEVVAGTAKS